MARWSPGTWNLGGGPTSGRHVKDVTWRKAPKGRRLSEQRGFSTSMLVSRSVANETDMGWRFLVDVCPRLPKLKLRRISHETEIPEKAFERRTWHELVRASLKV